MQDTAAVISLHEHRSWQWDSDSLNSLKCELASVDEETETGFLVLGGQVESFHSRAHEISRTAGEVLGLLNGEDGESTLQHLQLLVERCSLWIGATEKKSVQISELLNNVKSEIIGLSLPVHGLRKVIKTLHSLRVSTRIEASKGYASGARVLARSLDELGNLVYEKIDEICALSETLVPSIDASLDMERKARSGSIRVASSEVEEARRLLIAIVENCVETGQWTDRLKSRSDDVTKSFGEMIAALQFQDITRQRLEHVRSALTSLEDHIGNFLERADDNRDKDASRLFGRICRLQHGQLNFACDEFYTAAENLTDNLRYMASSVLSLADDTRELSRSADIDSENRFDAVLVVLKSIAEHLNNTRKIHKAAGEQLSEVCSGIRKVAGLVEEIELIGEEMQLLAMNAAINAAHARQDGAGLDIIAQNIHIVAEEATGHALSLASECEEITGHALLLQDIERETQSNSSDVGNLLGEAHERISMVEETCTRLTRFAGEVDRAAQDLAGEVNDVARTIDIKERFRDKVSTAMTRLDALGSLNEHELSATETANLEALFKELEYCYTMDSERQLHQQFVADTATVAMSETDEWSSSRDHGLGDNVDLF